MRKVTDGFKIVKMSLADVLGAEYVEAVVGARAAVRGKEAEAGVGAGAAVTGKEAGAVVSARAGAGREGIEALRRVATRRVDFLPERFQADLEALLPRTGRRVTRPLKATAAGASTARFDAATRTATAPLTGLGYFRVGEDGRLYLIAKSEHYHASLGHAFPGYRLVEVARRLGIPNATHNNTRGFITRRLEGELIRAANGDTPAGTPGALDRVLNLETGSLAVEAALKMVLARFYRSQDDSPEPVYKGRVPVVVVLGNDNGGLQGNYHGTTVLCQAMRGMWPDFAGILERSGALMVRCVRPNNMNDVRRVFAEYDSGKYKIAAFFHEIVMMNYGARLLTPEFLRAVYALCEERDVPTVDDEIQSCLWNPRLFMFREWGLKPSFVAVGKGFPGGEYPASRILFNSRFDILPQFGALVTNGQEELASLSYLITMAWARANAEVTRHIGEYFEERMRETAARHRSLIVSIDGSRHMLGIGFADVAQAKAIAADLNAGGIDISVQTYKSDCPPAALLKLPLIMGRRAVDFLVRRIDAALAKAAGGRKRMK